jgi:hypothetical protein
MSESHLFNPAGDLFAMLPSPATHDAILRAAYGLDPRDVLTCCAGHDDWTLTIIPLAERPAGNILRPLPFTVKEDVIPMARVGDYLKELAVLDLWDKGWRIVAAEG